MTRWVVAFVLLLAGCKPQSPLERLQKHLQVFPEYSIILNDMRKEGNFFPDYSHQYKVVVLKEKDTASYQEETTDWLTVPRVFYLNHTGNLGMVLAAKGGDGKKSDTAQPPGYQYVGNSRYGHWVDRGGGSFWAFYGQYSFIKNTFGMMHRPVQRDDYDAYRRNQRQGRSYYGKSGEFGSTGTETQKSHRNFYQRRQRKENMRRQAFSDRVKQRATRSHHSGFRRRSFGGFGK